MIKVLASSRLTLVGMLLLGGGAILSYGNPADMPVWVLVVPMAFLALNLICAMISNPRINRRYGLLVFHAGLLGVVILAAIGRLTHFDAHVEMLNGTAFDPSDLFNIRQGPLHNKNALDNIRFIQGDYTISYSPGIARGPTRNQVILPTDDGEGQAVTFGDAVPLVMQGYRFYTSFHKGFAPIMTWIPNQGENVTGTVHMPPYPLYDYRQANRWQPPGAPEIKFWLRLYTGIDANSDWILDAKKSTGILVVNSDDQRIELQPGEIAQLPGGQLRYEYMTSWMGYKVFYDPTLHWLFFTSVIGVMGLLFHFWQKVNKN